jgi:hypothetical protein
MPRTPSLRSLFLAWLCFSVAFNTVFQAFLTTFLVDSGYKTPIQNMDELLDSDSGVKLFYLPFYNSMSEIGEETELSKVHRNLAKCPSFENCLYWAIYQKNVSILLSDISAEMLYAVGLFVGEYSKPVLCRLEDGVVYPDSHTILMFHGDPLMRRFNEIIDCVVEAGLYNYWISLQYNILKIVVHKITIHQQLDEYYSFNLYHLQTAFYLLLMGWCLSAFCFMVEMLYHRVRSK